MNVSATKTTATSVSLAGKASEVASAAASAAPMAASSGPLARVHRELPCERDARMRAMLQTK
jgi:hypothetical protein